MSVLDAKPTDSKDDLLKDILVAASSQTHMPGLPLRPFAALMVKVADETAETVADLKAHITYLNKQNAKLQFWVFALAIAALVGTIVQTVAAIYALIGTTPSSVTQVGAASSSNPIYLQSVSQPHQSPQTKSVTRISKAASIANNEAPARLSTSAGQR